jgi:hypothetical protein
MNLKKTLKMLGIIMKAFLEITVDKQFERKIINTMEIAFRKTVVMT